MSTNRSRSGNGIVVAALFKGAKFLKVLKTFKFAKAFLSFFSMFLSVFVYSFSMGWPFAVGFIALLFIHEMGHVVAAARKGIPASVPLFIPFLGAAIFVPRMDKRNDESYMAFGGPFIGTIGAALCFAIFLYDPVQFRIFSLIAYTGTMVNAFNMIPVSPLDGGRILQVLGGWVKYVGVAALLAFTVISRNPGLLVVWVIVLSEARTLNPWFRFWLGAFLQAIIIGLYMSGTAVTDEPMDNKTFIIDMIIATTFNLMFLFLAWKGL